MSTNFSSDKIRSIKLKDKIYNIVGQPLHGTAAEWSNNDFTPQQGELVVYDADDSNVARVKIGDGATALSDLPFVHTDGDSKEVYGVDANKDGNVELVFGIYIPLINFTIRDSYGIGGPFSGYGDILSFQAEENMTWRQWVNSSYCTIKNYITMEYNVMIEGYPVYYSDWSAPAPDDLITSGYEYMVSG